VSPVYFCLPWQTVGRFFFGSVLPWSAQPDGFGNSDFELREFLGRAVSGDVTLFGISDGVERLNLARVGNADYSVFLA